ncbi:phage tail assembly chaperone [Mesorhizobium sp. CN5-321]|jgi:uncharacterized phage protein (TIGR02216 family)|uniref:phage tail assembly chaperone n=1 Tax=Mesorhizobium hunchu TaxID=3157708 RepID=UPI0032B85ECE
MRVAFGLLRLAPQVFWAMTPVEFERAVSALNGPRVSAPGRSDLTALMRAHPDSINKEAAIG